MLLNVTALQAQIQSLKGTVTVAGGDNSALATIRIVDQGIGTTSLLDGSYYLEDIAPVNTPWNIVTLATRRCVRS